MTNKIADEARESAELDESHGPEEDPETAKVRIPGAEIRTFINYPDNPDSDGYPAQFSVIQSASVGMDGDRPVIAGILTGEPSRRFTVPVEELAAFLRTVGADEVAAAAGRLVFLDTHTARLTAPFGENHFIDVELEDLPHGN